MKKIYFFLASLPLLGLISMTVSQTHAQMSDPNPFFYGNEYKETDPKVGDKTDLDQILKTEYITKDSNKSIIYKIRELFGLTSTDATSPYSNDKPAIEYVKMLTNMALGLVSFISLILVIVAFYMIFFGKGEDAVAKAKKMLIGVAVALVVMALAWIIVNFLFTLFNDQAKNL